MNTAAILILSLATVIIYLLSISLDVGHSVKSFINLLRRAYVTTGGTALIIAAWF